MVHFGRAEIVTVTLLCNKPACRKTPESGVNHKRAFLHSCFVLLFFPLNLGLSHRQGFSLTLSSQRLRAWQMTVGFLTLESRGTNYLKQPHMHFNDQKLHFYSAVTRWRLRGGPSLGRDFSSCETAGVSVSCLKAAVGTTRPRWSMKSIYKLHCQLANWIFP